MQLCTRMLRLRDTFGIARVISWPRPLCPSVHQYSIGSSIEDVKEREPWLVAQLTAAHASDRRPFGVELMQATAVKLEEELQARTLTEAANRSAYHVPGTHHCT